jgi:hypothetical protein
MNRHGRYFVDEGALVIAAGDVANSSANDAAA